jgi:hypothetical protein
MNLIIWAAEDSGIFTGQPVYFGELISFLRLTEKVTHINTYLGQNA